MGHPCCNEHDCKEPLRKVFDEFCPSHQFLGSLCCIETCSSPREPGFRTCKTISHRAEEKRRSDCATARATRRRVRGVGGLSYMKDAEDTFNAAGRGKGVKKGNVKGVFARRWTHNEQLMVRPCGIIIGRATFYAAESNSGVSVSLSWSYPPGLYIQDADRHAARLVLNRHSSTAYSPIPSQVHYPTFCFSITHAGSESS